MDDVGTAARVISFIGTKGSAGCTFLTVALGRCLAAGGLATLLVDADAEDGAMGVYLGQHPAPAGQAQQVAGGLSWMELSAEGDPREFIAMARHQGNAVVVDLGHRPDQAQRRIASVSDWLVWVVVPDRLGLDRADRALGSGLIAASSQGLAFNRLGPSRIADAERVISERYRMPVMARLPERPRAARLALEGRPVDASGPLRRPLQELARAVHPGYPRRTRAWP
jgi:Flp pilus assembly CpaE family ATPase